MSYMQIFVDFGYKADGIIPRNEYSEDEKLNPKIQEEKFYYSIVENGFICNKCFTPQNQDEIFELSSEAIIFLQAVTLLSPKEARSIPLHYSTTQQLHEFLTFLINRYTGCKLKTLEISTGIF